MAKTSTFLTITLNAALDITYSMQGVSWGESNRVVAVADRAGGKGINVARILHRLGARAIVGGLAGGRQGAAIRADVARAGLCEQLLEIGGESRRTVAVVDRLNGVTTLLSEPGPATGELEWAAFLARFDELLDSVDVLVLSGSLPPGLPPDAYAVLAARAAARAVRTVLDADGEALARGIGGRPAVVKPNRRELAGWVGSELEDLEAVASAADQLRQAGAGAVVVSLGAEGLLAVTEQGSWRALPPEKLAGNPTGAGDAAVAALALGLANGTSWQTRLRDAAALSAAAVSAPLAGDFDEAAYRRLQPQVTVEPS